MIRARVLVAGMAFAGAFLCLVGASIGITCGLLFLWGPRLEFAGLFGAWLNVLKFLIGLIMTAAGGYLFIFGIGQLLLFELPRAWRDPTRWGVN